MLIPTIVPAHPRADSPLALAVLALGLAVFAALGARALRTFLLTHREADLAVCIGLAWLGASLASAVLFTWTEFGWWLGHGVELFGIMIVGGSVAFDLQRGVLEAAVPRERQGRFGQCWRCEWSERAGACARG